MNGSQGNKEGSATWQLIIAAVFAAFITFLVYLPALRNGFINLDDARYVTKNAHITVLNGKLLKWAFFSFYASNWHPLTWISHAVDYALWGLDPFGHHLTSIVLHSLNTFLVVVLARQLLVAAGRQNGGLIAALVTGLLFGLHPLHVESVAWVAERKDVLCAFFYILSVLAYIKYADLNTDAGTKKYSYISSLLFFSLAILSKPMAVTLPAVLFLLDYSPLDRLTKIGWKRVLLEKLPFLALGIFSTFVTLCAQRGAMSDSMGSYFLIKRLLVAAKAVFLYTLKIIYPIDLIPFYPYPRIVSIASLEYAAPLVFLVLISAITLVLKNKHLLAVWSYFLITLIPVLGIVQVGSQAMADRYTYLPSIGPFLAAGAAFGWAYLRIRHRKVGIFAFISAAVLIFSLMTYVTVSQIGTWKDSMVLWQRVIDVTSKKAGGYYWNLDLAYVNLGSVQVDRGLYKDAIESYSRAIELNPRFAEVYASRAKLYTKFGRFEDAARDYSDAISISRNDAELYYNRGNAYANAGLFFKALDDYTMAIALGGSGRADYYHNRAVIYKKLKMDDKAAQDMNKADLMRGGE